MCDREWVSVFFVCECVSGERDFVCLFNFVVVFQFLFSFALFTCIYTNLDVLVCVCISFYVFLITLSISFCVCVRDEKEMVSSSFHSFIHPSVHPYIHLFIVYLLLFSFYCRRSHCHRHRVASHLVFFSILHIYSNKSLILWTMEVVSLRLSIVLLRCAVHMYNQFVGWLDDYSRCLNVCQT